MAVVEMEQGLVRRYRASRTDVKPTENVPEGSTLDEIDTGEHFEFYLGAWRSLSSSIQAQLLEELKQLNRSVNKNFTALTDALRPVIEGFK